MHDRNGITVDVHHEAVEWLSDVNKTFVCNGTNA